MIRLAPEGWPFVAGSLALTGLAVGVGAFLPPSSPRLSSVLWGLSALGLVLTAFVLFFFRNPVRRRRDADGLVLSPADGRIVEITPLDDDDLLLRPANRISVFLSIFSVHIQRAPITGRVGLKSYRAGRFAMAWKSKASEDNEQATLGIADGPHRIIVRQIAGWVARRIVTDPEKGDLVPQGSRIGLIRFGSRVDLFIPQEWELSCKVGDRVKGGLTALARLPEPVDGKPT